MCGLAGVLSGHLSKQDIEIFQGLMVVSTLRGAMGSGVAAYPIKKSQEPRSFKSATWCAAELVTQPDFFKLTKAPLTCLMGHARLPTSGGYDDDAAHPHMSGSITGMHNGTITKVADRVITSKDCDSKILFESIATKGVKDTIENTVGAYALTYFDTKDNTVNFIRNDKRTLYFGKPPEVTDTVFWASEANFLRFIIGRYYPTGASVIYRTKPDMLYKFSARPKMVNLIADSWMEIKQRTGAPVTVTPPFLHRTQAMLPAPTTQSNGCSGTDPTKEQTYDNTHMHETKRSTWVPEGQIQMALAKGCSWCGQPATWFEFQNKRTYWHDPLEFICHDCAIADPTAEHYANSSGFDVIKPRN